MPERILLDQPDIDDAHVEYGSEVIGGALLNARNPEIFDVPSDELRERSIDAACWRLRRNGLTEAEIAAARLAATEIEMDFVELTSQNDHV